MVTGDDGNDTVLGRGGNDQADGGDGNDRVVGGTGDDILQAGLGLDRLEGEDGSDNLRSRDGLRDVVSCGAGFDRVDADTLDEITDDCESVTRTATAPPPGDWSSGDDTVRPRVQAGGATVQRLGRGGRIRIAASSSERGTIAASGFLDVAGLSLPLISNRRRVAVAGGGVTLTVKLKGRGAEGSAARAPPPPPRGGSAVCGGHRQRRKLGHTAHAAHPAAAVVRGRAPDQRLSSTLRDGPRGVARGVPDRQPQRDADALPAHEARRDLLPEPQEQPRPAGACQRRGSPGDGPPSAPELTRDRAGLRAAHGGGHPAEEVAEPLDPREPEADARRAPVRPPRVRIGVRGHVGAGVAGVAEAVGVSVDLVLIREQGAVVARIRDVVVVIVHVAGVALTVTIGVRLVGVREAAAVVGVVEGPVAIAVNAVGRHRRGRRCWRPPARG